MVIRPIDANGDILPISDISQMATGKKAVSNVVDLRLNFFYGEWWEDRTLGFRVPEFLINTARSGDIGLLSKYITSYISDSEGVRAVTNVQATLNKHELTFYCEVLTTEGQTETVEVSVNGIL